ncbi:MAG: TetR/AcrR family transcriptional regulator [Myxococcales bacterium]|nr:MAG: TetR/AcrR family transcriptional regulator [Myxococcales bacterium]
MAELSVTDPQPSRRERRRLEVRARILEAALTLFETQGYEATTVTEVARRADIAYGTFFNHFPSKLHLLRELSDLALQGLFENVEEVRKRPGSFAEHLIALFESSAERAEDKGPRMRELLGAMMALAFPETAGQDDRRIRIAFRSILEDGLAAGEFREGIELDTLTDVVVGTWYAMFLSWVHFDDYPLRGRASSAARFLADTLIGPRVPALSRET